MTFKNQIWMINPATDATIPVNPDRTIVSANPRAADIVLTTLTRWKGTSLDTRRRIIKKTPQKQHFKGFFSELVKCLMG
jgi:hypothetical protein